MLTDETSQTEKHVSVDPISMNPLPLLPTNYKFLTTSLPNSPRIGALSRPRSQSHLQRSKSGGDERSSLPYGGFDLWANLSNTGYEHKSSRKHGKKGTSTNNEAKKYPNEMDNFKCGSLCLFLPGFGKGKPVRAAKRVEPQGSATRSHRVSLEKFECGSWRSSAIHTDDDRSSTLYFDLPLELIRTSVSVSENGLPMNSAFVFGKGGVKGVLKRNGERKSGEGRHVRFSTSSSPATEPASPITPRLCKARDDFRAFLEAQSV